MNFRCSTYVVLTCASTVIDVTVLTSVTTFELSSVFVARTADVEVTVRVVGG